MQVLARPRAALPGAEHERLAFAVDRRFGAVREIHLPGASETATIATDTWQLPGLTAELQTPLSKPAVERERDTIRITYQAQEDQEIARFRFRVR